MKPNGIYLKSCPVLVVRDGATERCGAVLQASRTIWTTYTEIEVDLANDRIDVEKWGDEFERAALGEDGSRVYCADDHTETEILYWIAKLQEVQR